MLKEGISKYSMGSIKLYRCWRSCTGYKPLHVEWLISHQCNLRCKMCNVWKIGSNSIFAKQNELSYLEGVKFLSELSRLGTRLLTLSGGEPMLRKDIFDIIKKAKEEQLEVEMITNGTLITKSSAEDLIESGLDGIVFSIDAPVSGPHDVIRGVEGCWKRAIEGMHYVNCARQKRKNAKLKVSLNVVVASSNYRLLKEIVMLKPQLGYDTISFLPPIPKTRAAGELMLTKTDLIDFEKNYLPSLSAAMSGLDLPLSPLSTIISLCNNPESTLQGKYALPKRQGILCFQPWLMVTVDPFGNVYPCCHACIFQNLSEDLTQGFFGSQDFNMGNLHINTFEEIWNGEKFIKFRSDSKNRPLPFSMCVYCDYGYQYDLFLTTLFKNRKFFPNLIRNLIRRILA